MQTSAPVPVWRAAGLRPGAPLLIYLCKLLGFYVSSQGFKYLLLGLTTAKLKSLIHTILEPKFIPELI